MLSGVKNGDFRVFYRKKMISVQKSYNIVKRKIL